MCSQFHIICAYTLHSNIMFKLHATNKEKIEVTQILTCFNVAEVEPAVLRIRIRDCVPF